MNVLITGATGMVGGEVMRKAVEDSAIDKVYLLTRRPPNFSHPKIELVLHDNFLNYDSLKDIFSKIDACIWCLGISQFSVGKEKYIEITYDYTVAAANVLLAANPKMSMVFLSGDGADINEKASTLFGKIKGRTENYLSELPFIKFYYARPAAIRPVRKKEKQVWYETLFFPLYPLFGLISPVNVIRSDDLASALLWLTKNERENGLIDKYELRKLAGIK